MNLIFCRYNDDECLVYQEKDVVPGYIKRVDIPCTKSDIEKMSKLPIDKVKTLIGQVLDGYVITLK